MVTPSPAHLLEVSAMTLENPWCSAWWWSTRFLMFWFLVFSHGWSHLAQVLSPPCLASMCFSRSPNCPLHCGQTRRTVRISLSLWSSSVSWVGKPIKTLIRSCDGQKHKAEVWQFCDPPTIVIKQLGNHYVTKSFEILIMQYSPSRHFKNHVLQYLNRGDREEEV